ncbi:hypothetical protein CLJ1_4058 [Pseudomonas paraeruginosa]|nr:hypothetical protein CLJ1_4058 [Pseudomonas aeruginosa]
MQAAAEHGPGACARPRRVRRRRRPATGCRSRDRRNPPAFPPPRRARPGSSGR